MKTTNDYQANYFSVQLTRQDFKQLSEFIKSNLGIKMPEAKKGLIEGRLRKRLRTLKLKTYTDYCSYLFSQEGMERELPDFINVVTTNKTDFFREPDHFDFLVEKAVPALISKKRFNGNKVHVWSSASSRGNEAYTIAMMLSEFGVKHSGFDFFILGTDISTEVLAEAQKGIYPHYEIDPVPLPLRSKYFLKSKDHRKNLVRINPSLRSKVAFRKLNLMDQDYKLRKLMDVIFCRNVMIYFDKITQEGLIRRLFQNLVPGGYLFMGHSEVLHDHNLPLKNVAPAVYQKIG